MADVQDEINEVKAEIALAKSERAIARRDRNNDLVIALTNEISELQRKENLLLSRSSGNTTLPDLSLLSITI